MWRDCSLLPVWWILPRYISVGGSMSREEYQISWWSAIIVKYCDRGGNTSVLDRVSEEYQMECWSQILSIQPSWSHISLKIWNSCKTLRCLRSVQVHPVNIQQLQFELRYGHDGGHLAIRFYPQIIHIAASLVSARASSNALFFRVLYIDLRHDRKMSILSSLSSTIF